MFIQQDITAAAYPIPETKQNENEKFSMILLSIPTILKSADSPFVDLHLDI